MAADRYLKVILTLIALELLWIGVKGNAPPVLAQQEPSSVVVTGFRIGKQDYTALPVVVVGSVPPSSIPSSREPAGIQGLSMRVVEPVVIEARQTLPVQVNNQPLTVESGSKALMVDVVPARPGVRPGEAR